MKHVDWEKAMNTGRSTRSFEILPIEASKMNLLQQFIENMEVPFEHNVKIRMFKADSNKKLYTVFSSPPDNLAFIANTDTLSIATVGFIGELAILYATSLGLATCWYGHYTLAELERLMPHLGEYAEIQNPKWGYGKGQVDGERTVCITPVGYRKVQGVRFFDRMQESLISYKRKPMETFLQEGIDKESIPPEIIFAIDLARKAPSAANSQHWRFTVSSDFKTITLTMPIGYKHIKWEHPNVDIGICASHFWLGLKLKNIPCQISLKEEEGRCIWQFHI